MGTLFLKCIFYVVLVFTILDFPAAAQDEKEWESGEETLEEIQKERGKPKEEIKKPEKVEEKPKEEIKKPEKVEKKPKEKKTDYVEDEFDLGESIPDQIVEQRGKAKESKYVEDEFGLGEDEADKIVQERGKPKTTVSPANEWATMTELPPIQEEEGFNPLRPFHVVRKKMPKWLDETFTKGKLVYQSFYHPRTTELDGRHIRNEGHLEFEINYSKEIFSLKLVPEFDIDDNDFANGCRGMERLEDVSPNRNIFNIKEGYIQGAFDRIRVRLGKQIFSWGKSFGYNLNEKINPYDLLDLIEGNSLISSRKMGVWSTGVWYFFPDLGIIEQPILEAVMVPLFTPSRLPGIDNRWNTTPVFPPEAPIVLDERELPSHTFDQVQYAVKASFTIRGYDFAFMFYDGIQPTPFQSLLVENKKILVPNPAPLPPIVIKYPILHITPTFHHLRTVGASVVTTVDAFKLYVEGAHTWYDSRDAESYLQLVFGLQYSWSSFLGVADYKLDFTTEFYLAEVTQNAKKRLPDINLPGLNPEELTSTRPYPERSFLFTVTYTYSPKTEFSFSTSCNMDKNFRRINDYFMETKVSHKVNDDLIISLSWQVLNGNHKYPFGQLTQNDRVILSIEYYF